MKNWKDWLPGHEPGEDSWQKIEKSLRMEEQLRRELPNLPEYEPDEACWEKDIVPRLPAGTGRFQWHRWAAAAAVLIVVLSGTLFLMERNRDPDDQMAANTDTPSGLVSAGMPVAMSDSNLSARAESSPGSKSASPAGNPSAIGDHADVRRSADVGHPEAIRHPEALNNPPSIDGAPEVGRPAEVGNDAEVAGTPAIAKNIEEPNDELPVPDAAEHNGRQTGADSLQLAAAPSTTGKTVTGRHRVIRIQWKVAEKPGLTLARRPADRETEKKNGDNHLIKIKL